MSAGRAGRVECAFLAAALCGSLSASGAAADVTGPPGVEIDGYELVGSVRIDRNWFEYTYRALLANAAFDATFGATLSTTAPSIVPVDVSLTFGEVFEGGTGESVDTFTVRVNRSVPFDATRLDWLVTAAPLPPTTFELIDAALANGQIDHETELIYKTYDSFADPRLPAAFDGRDDGFIDDPVTPTVRAEWTSLSPATQAILAPFLLHALEPGSWQELRFQAGAQAAGSSASAAAAAPSDAQSVDTANGKVRVWWYLNRPQDEARAIAFANEIDTYLWQKLTSAFRSPAPDLVALGPTSPIYFMGDDRLDIVLSETDRAATAHTLQVCDGRPSGAAIQLGPRDDKQTLAHELMHAIQLAYPSMDCKERSELRWMMEATATWAQHFAYPTLNLEHGGTFGGRRTRGAMDFLKTPDLPLDFTDDQHEYGAYLWIMHLAGQDNNAGPIRAAWEGVATQTSLESIETQLQGSGRGGFKRQWPAFALRAWNRVARIEKPYREFFQWDRLHHSAQEAFLGPRRIVPPNNSAAIVPIEHLLQPLSMFHQHFDFRRDDKTHQVWVENQYASPDSQAGLWAIVKVKNRGWVQAQDWTDRSKVVLCRDKADENVEELILVITNRFHSPGAGILGGPDTHTASPITMTLSPLPCNDWLGTANFDTAEVFEDATLTTRSRATGVRFTLDEARSSPAINYYRADAGTAAWTIEETGGGCATRQAAGTFGVAGNLMIMLGGSTLYHGIFGLGPGSSTVVTVGCPGGPTDFYFSFDAWMPSSIGLLPLANGATRIQGGQVYDPAMPAVGGWTWTFDKVP